MYKNNKKDQETHILQWNIIMLLHELLFQFVELKGSVFKKFDKNNLFQLSCADVRERFHLMMLLLAVNLQTMKEYAWKAERLAVLLPDCIMLLSAEVLVDWVNRLS